MVSYDATRIVPELIDWSIAASIFDMLQDANPGRGFSSSMDYREAYKVGTLNPRNFRMI